MSDTTNQNTGAGSNDNSGAQSNQQNAGPQTMSLDDATIERIAAASSRQAAQNVRQDAQQNHQDNGAQSNGSTAGNQSDVLTAIQALPEQITRSIKEALQPPQQTGAQSNNSQQNSGADGNGSQSQDTGAQRAATQEPGKRKSFGDWWFGT